jgi:transcriptional regulator with XRE-family HTH domain
MTRRDIAGPHYPIAELLDAIAEWINKYRRLHRVTDELGQCTQDDVIQIAKDLGLSVSELRNLAAKGPGGAEVLQKMLLALSIDPKVLAKNDPATMRDLQRLCIVCSHKGRCQEELAAGTAAEHFREFCPNAYTIDALFKQNEGAQSPAPSNADAGH